MRKLPIAAIALLLAANAHAGTATFDFAKDPAQDPNIILNGGNATPWQATSGNPGGFLALLYSVNSTAEVVVFPDIDKGQTVKAFTFECDLRIGNAQGNSGRPADGFSVSFARANDPVLAGLPDSAIAGNMAQSGQPENGTKTGIAVGFDTWQGNVLPDKSTDIEGIIVRVDNTTILEYGMPTRNGTCDDSTSMQTGPYNGDYWTNGGDPMDPAAWAGLCWAHLKVELDDAGRLTVTYKNKVILDHAQTTFFPSAGRLVLAGRTGGANENTHFDNITITTVPTSLAVVSGVAIAPDGFTVKLDDGTSAVDPATIAIKFDNATITPASVTKSGATTSVKYTSPTFLASGSSHDLAISFKDKNGAAVSATRTLQVQTYQTASASFAISTGVDKTKPGFRIRPWQTDQAEPNNNAWAEDELAGKHGANQADLSSADKEGFYDVPDVVNFDIGGGAGNFMNDNPFPGLPGAAGNGTDNSAVEVLTFLEFPSAGFFTMGVNSDDGFKVTTGANVKDVFALKLGEFSGGRGAADTTFLVLVEKPGIFPVRLIWENGGGGANLEWFTVNSDGTKVLINDTSAAGSIKAYRVGPPGGTAYIESVSPGVGATDADGAAGIGASLVDGANKVTTSSVKMTLDGVTVAATATKSGTKTSVTFKPATNLAFGSRHTVSLSYNDDSNPPVARTVGWDFTVAITEKVFVAGTLFIEAEDFNFGHGQYINNKPIGMSGAYPGGDYQDKGDGNNGSPRDGSDYGIDYNTDHASSPQAVYRPNTPIGAGKRGDTAAPPAAGLDRGTFSIQLNHVVGWNDVGDWYNYTRDFPTPAKDYNVFAHLASGGADEAGELGQISGGATTTNQTKKVLGTFKAPATGGWDTWHIVQLKDDKGSPIAVNFGGQTTLRFTVLPGNLDFDYLAFVPATGAQLLRISAERSATGLTVTFTGTLQSADAVTGPWADVAKATSPLAVTPAGGQKFYRAKQ